jgi:beta-glucosidase/6-phospho-beta-glucosidase/beta-galactosidase
MSPSLSEVVSMMIRAFSPDETGRVPDTRRIAFHRQILADLARAIADGARVRAYHAWSLVDNFEWSDGTRSGMALLM